MQMYGWIFQITKNIFLDPVKGTIGTLRTLRTLGSQPAKRDRDTSARGRSGYPARCVGRRFVGTRTLAKDTNLGQ